MNYITREPLDRVELSSAADLPSRWFNILSCLPERVAPPLDPDDGRPSRIKAMNAIRLAALARQDGATDPWIDIPPPVLECYRTIGRPTPLYRARALEEYLGTPASIYLKREDLLPSGAFKLNSAIAQAYFAAEEGVSNLVTETGAGQWALSVAFAARLFDIHATIFWVRLSEAQKKYRSALAKMLGAEIIPSPSDRTEVGRTILERDPDSYGSLGTAIGEAIAYAQTHPEFRYISGSNLAHVLLHQTIIGLETKQQLSTLGIRPDVLVACVGGGSNLGGFMGPFVPDKLAAPGRLRLVAAESAASPRLTQGEWRYDHADPAGLTPLTKSYTLGREYPLPPTHVGGLRQHSGSPIIGVLRKTGLLEAHAYAEPDIFETGKLCLRLEGFLPAPESCHALRAALDVAVEAKQVGRTQTIVACVSGGGLLDLSGYIEVLGL
jgi:tryptophan synthase beta chain